MAKVYLLISTGKLQKIVPVLDTLELFSEIKTLHLV